MKIVDIDKYQKIILWYIHQKMKIEKQQISKIILWYTHQKNQIVNVKIKKKILISEFNTDNIYWIDIVIHQTTDSEMNQPSGHKCRQGCWHFHICPVRFQCMRI